MATRFRYLPLLLLLAAFGLMPACEREEPALRVDLSRRESLAAPEKVRALTYAYLPQFSHAESFRRHRLMTAYLSKTLGMPVRQVFPDTFDEHVRMVARGEIDVSYSNPFVYVRLADLGARAVARVVEDGGGADFRGEVIVRSDNKEIAALDDCRGKRWIAVDPSSAGGYLFPLGYFHDHGITARDFAEIAFAPGPGGKQEKVILSVLSGAYDLGSIREGALAVLGERIDQSRIRVLGTTRPYPGWTYSVRPGLDPELTKRIGRALCALSLDDPEQAAVLEAAHIRGVIPARDQDYEPVRELVRKLGLETFEGR